MKNVKTQALAKNSQARRVQQSSLHRTRHAQVCPVHIMAVLQIFEALPNLLPKGRTDNEEKNAVIQQG